MAALGLSREDLCIADTFELWPENFEPVRVFEAMRTQWRVGTAGAYGLDYQVLPFMMSTLGVKKKCQQQIFHAIRILEIEAIRVMRES